MEKRLFRNTKDKMIGGVCSGLADYLDVDPTVIRLLTVASLFAGLPGLVYIIAWIIIPEEK